MSVVTVPRIELFTKHEVLTQGEGRPFSKRIPLGSKGALSGPVAVYFELEGRPSTDVYYAVEFSVTRWKSDGPEPARVARQVSRRISADELERLSQTIMVPEVEEHEELQASVSVSSADKKASFEITGGCVEFYELAAVKAAA